MKNIAVIGPIGCGKSTFIFALKQKFKELYPNLSIRVEQEPSISVPYLNEVLKKFYENKNGWAYPLQLEISAINEIQFQNLRESNYDILLFDSPFSSFEYCNINKKSGRITEEERKNIDNISRPFNFDYVIIVKENLETTIKRVQGRNIDARAGSLSLAQEDVPIDDLSYLEDHIKEYGSFEEEYLKKYFPNAQKIVLEHIPEKTNKSYEKLLRNIATGVIMDTDTTERIFIGKEE